MMPLLHYGPKIQKDVHKFRFFFRFQDMSLASCLFHSYLEKESIKSIRVQCIHKSYLKFATDLSFFLNETKIN